MENKTNYPLSAKSDALKRLISEVFVLTDYSALQGLPSRLKVLGHHSAAEALTQILENEITAPVLTLKKVSRRYFRTQYQPKNRHPDNLVKAAP